MSQQRQLAAIMFTDLEGYTAIMQQDEAEAVKIRTRHRNTFERTTEAFNGEIIQYFGDGTLSVFRSTVEAVNCAIELQTAYLEDPKIPVRIGIHVGDIIFSKEDIIGDAVNVASRIESCAVAGSILVSDKINDQIRSHQNIESKFLDVYELKNVEEAMPLFAIANEGLVVPKPEEVKGKLKGKVNQNTETSNKKRNLIASLVTLIVLITCFFLYLHFSDKSISSNIHNDRSIAVLPFDNLSSEEDAEIFRDGMTEDILTYLSKINELHVISRTSVMQYKNTEKTIPEIAKELGVSYILEGSIRKYGNKIRVTAQLIDAKTDEHVWAENYDKTLTDIFKLQSELSREIVDALELNIDFEEQQALTNIPTENIEAYKLFLTGRQEADKRNSESIAKSIVLYKEAIELDSVYAEAYAEIANSIYLETYYSGRDPIEASELAKTYLVKAEKLNNKIARIYSVKGLIDNIEGKPEVAKKAFEKAIKLSPNDVTSRHQFSTFYFYTRDYEKQLEQAKIAYSLDPLSFATTNSYFTALMSNFKYDEAEVLIKRLDAQNVGNNKFVINRSFFRLYIDQEKYKEVIPHLEQMVKTQNVFNRFLGYSYAKIGDTVNSKRIIKNIRENVADDEYDYQLAVVYSGLKMTDSALFHLDISRNKQTSTFKREYNKFFKYLKDDDRFNAILDTHGIKTNE